MNSGNLKDFDPVDLHRFRAQLRVHEILEQTAFRQTLMEFDAHGLLGNRTRKLVHLAAFDVPDVRRGVPLQAVSQELLVGLTAVHRDDLLLRSQPVGAGFVDDVQVRLDAIGAGEDEIHGGGGDLLHALITDTKDRPAAVLGLYGADGGLEITLTIGKLAQSVGRAAIPEAGLVLGGHFDLELTVDDAGRAADVPLLGVELLGVEVILPDRLQASIRSGAQRQGGKEGEKREGFHEIGVRTIEIGGRKEASPTRLLVDLDPVDPHGFRSQFGVLEVLQETGFRETVMVKGDIHRLRRGRDMGRDTDRVRKPSVQVPAVVVRTPLETETVELLGVGGVAWHRILLRIQAASPLLVHDPQANADRIAATVAEAHARRRSLAVLVADTETATVTASLQEHDGGFDEAGLGTVLTPRIHVRASPEHGLRSRRDFQRELTVHDFDAVGVADIPLLLIDLLLIKLVGPNKFE